MTTGVKNHYAKTKDKVAISVVPRLQNRGAQKLLHPCNLRYGHIRNSNFLNLQAKSVRVEARVY